MLTLTSVEISTFSFSQKSEITAKNEIMTFTAVSHSNHQNPIDSDEHFKFLEDKSEISTFVKTKNNHWAAGFLDVLVKVGVRPQSARHMLFYIDAGNGNEAAVWNPHSRGVVNNTHSRTHVPRSMDQLVWVFGPTVWASTAGATDANTIFVR